jgi:hypothetical protein
MSLSLKEKNKFLINTDSVPDHDLISDSDPSGSIQDLLSGRVVDPGQDGS